MSRRVGFATAAEWPHLAAEDRSLVEPAAARGIVIEPVVWDDPDQDLDALAALDALVIRSCWDYHRKAPAFRAWIDRLESRGVRLLNPAPTLRWSLHKSYLLDLGRSGVTIPRTTMIPRGSSIDLATFLRRHELREVVLKPAIGLCGYDTYRVPGPSREEDQRRLDSLLAMVDVLVQEFVPGILDLGESSLIFLDGDFSHAVLKLPAAGEFRVQEEHGGRRTHLDPEPWVLVDAHRVLAAIPHPWRYARVDGIAVDGRLMLMELEVIDPSFFLGYDPLAPGRVLGALERWVDLSAPRAG